MKYNAYKKYGSARERGVTIMINEKPINLYYGDLLPGIGQSQFDLHELKGLMVCLWGECRGEQQDAIECVTQVIMNRSMDDRPEWPNSVSGVIEQPKQFSFFNKEHRNIRAKIIEDYMGWVKVVQYGLPIYLHGSTEWPCNMYWYHDDTIAPPHWTDKLTLFKKIGHLSFYCDGAPDYYA